MTNMPGAETRVSHAAPIRQAAVGAATWLGLAAAPVFATMALISGSLGEGRLDALCAAMGTSSLRGMTLMYVLMSVVHLPPWLRLMSEAAWNPKER